MKKETIATILVGSAILAGGVIVTLGSEIRYEKIDNDSYRKITDGVAEIKTVSDDIISFQYLRSQIHNPIEGGKIQGKSKYERYLLVDKERSSLIQELQRVSDVGIPGVVDLIGEMSSIPVGKL